MSVKRIVFALFAAVCLSTLATAATFAWENRLSGEPTMLQPGQIFGVFAWVGPEGTLFLRSTAVRDYSHHFSGTVTTDGTFYALHVLDGNDDSAWVNGHTLTYNFNTFDGLDGIEYRIAGGTYQSVAAYYQGNLMDVQNIYLGANGAHPEFNPWNDFRNP